MDFYRIDHYLKLPTLDGEVYEVWATVGFCHRPSNTVISISGSLLKEIHISRNPFFIGMVESSNSLYFRAIPVTQDTASLEAVIAAPSKMAAAGARKTDKMSLVNAWQTRMAAELIANCKDS